MAVSKGLVLLVLRKYMLFDPRDMELYALDIIRIHVLLNSLDYIFKASKQASKDNVYSMSCFSLSFKRG
jgi:hypothetical protein